MKILSILFLWLASCILSLGAGALNGVAVTHWNGIAFTAWNGSGVSAGGGGGGGDTTFITGVTLGAKTAPSGQVGIKITVGASPITVTEVGLYGNTTKFAATMDVYIRSSGGTDLGHATVTWGTASQFYYATLGTPIVLSASTVYYVMTDSLGFNDVYSSAATATTTAVAAINDTAYGQPPTDEASGAGKIYGPLDFKYH